MFKSHYPIGRVFTPALFRIFPLSEKFNCSLVLLIQINNFIQSLNFIDNTMMKYQI